MLITRDRLKSVMFVLVKLFWSRTKKSSPYALRDQRIEDYPEGYPRFSALIAADNSFSICRRFLNLRSRLLLLKQDRLSLLEKKLEKVDEDETEDLFVRSSRYDKNAERSAVLLDINDALKDYDEFLKRNHQILRYEDANVRDLVSLQNWLRGNACLTRAETAYLTYFNDLMSLNSSNDTAMTKLETWVEDCLIKFYKGFRQHPGYKISSDPHVYIQSGSLIRRLCQMLLLIFATVFLLVPAAICNSTSSVTVRLIVISVSIVWFLATLSALLNARIIEVLLAGATYATVLTVFVSGGGSTT